MSAAEQIEGFCSALIGGPDGSGDDRLAGQMVYVWTLPDRRTRWCRADEPGTVASAVLDAAGRQQRGIEAVYIGLGGIPAELAQEKGSNHRSEIEDVTMVPGLWADLDVGTFGHRGTNYPPDTATARRILDSLGVPPTMVVDSGYGIQAWWAFSEPWLASDHADPDAARRELYDLSRDWISTLRFRADCMGGWKVDSVFDLSRVMRAPGTWNLKDPDSPKPVRLLTYDKRAFYEFDHFRAVLASQKVLDSYSLRIDGKGFTHADLPGVDLGEVWARVNSEHYAARKLVPEWLEQVLDIDATNGGLTLTWEGRRPEFGGDASSYDAALVRILHDMGLSLELQVEALMCRRLRSGEKPDKVDPRRRVDYILRTMGFVQASARQAEEKTTKATSLREQDAARTLPEPPDEEAPPAPEEGGDEFTRYLEAELDAETAPVPDPVERARDVIERQQGLPPRPTPGSAPEPKPLAVVDPFKPPPVPVPVAQAPAPDLWGERSVNVVERLDALGELLIPEAYRRAGVSVWRLEHKDYGENQRGRVAFKLPTAFAWPANNPPKLYRPGKPLFSEWYKRDVFETPKGYRMALERDAMIPAEVVGNRKEDWATLISLLVSYWEGDSSASDLASSAGEWLLNWLLSHAPTTEESEAVDNARALLVSHSNWGRDGAPVIFLPKASWLSYVATQPGGPTGRNGNSLLAYVHLIPRRPRLVGGDGSARRVSWFEIASDQFEAEDWEAVLDVVRQAMDAREKRKLRAVAGGS